MVAADVSIRSALPEKAGGGTPTALLGDRSMLQKELGDFSPTVHDCPSCNETFDSQRGMKIHHKRIHGESIAGEVFDCDWCGETVRRDPSHIHNEMNNFCSAECRGSYRSEHYTGEDASRWDGGKVEATCEVCGGTYLAYPSVKAATKTCSKECRYQSISEALSGENSYLWTGGTIEMSCEYCGTDFPIHPSEADDRRFCTRSCYEQWFSRNKNGQNHPRWNGGKSIYDAVKKLLGTRSWDQAREAALSEEGDACGMCGDPPKPNRRLDVHHLIPIMAGGCNADELLMPLCQKCHGVVESYTWTIPEVEPMLTEEIGA